jgi:hypothetical protein
MDSKKQARLAALMAEAAAANVDVRDMAKTAKTEVTKQRTANAQSVVRAINNYLKKHGKTLADTRITKDGLLEVATAGERASEPRRTSTDNARAVVSLTVYGKTFSNIDGDMNAIAQHIYEKNPQAFTGRGKDGSTVVYKLDNGQPVSTKTGKRYAQNMHDWAPLERFIQSADGKRNVRALLPDGSIVALASVERSKTGK